MPRIGLLARIHDKSANHINRELIDSLFGARDRFFHLGKIGGCVCNFPYLGVQYTLWSMVWMTFHPLLYVIRL